MKISKTNSSIIEQTEMINAFISIMRKNKPLTKEEEQLEFKKYKQGTSSERESAKKKIMLSNQRFVYSVAKRYTSDASTVMDLVEEGNIGMAEAIDLFDIERNTKFITFAVYYIEREIKEYLSQDNTLITRSNDRKIGFRLDKIKGQFFAENGRYPSIEEIKDVLKNRFSIDVVSNLDLLDVNITFLDDTLNDESTAEDGEEYNNASSTVNEYEKVCDSIHTAAIVDGLLHILDKRSAEIIRMSFGIGYDYEIDPDDIAEALKLTRTRVLQIKADAIKRMSDYAKSHRISL